MHGLLLAFDKWQVMCYDGGMKPSICAICGGTTYSENFPNGVRAEFITGNTMDIICGNCWWNIFFSRDEILEIKAMLINVLFGESDA